MFVINWLKADAELVEEQTLDINLSHRIKGGYWLFLLCIISYPRTRAQGMSSEIR
jgi:hypothetical protein